MPMLCALGRQWKPPHIAARSTFALSAVSPLLKSFVEYCEETSKRRSGKGTVGDCSVASYDSSVEPMSALMGCYFANENREAAPTMVFGDEAERVYAPAPRPSVWKAKAKIRMVGALCSLRKALATKQSRAAVFRETLARAEMTSAVETRKEALSAKATISAVVSSMHGAEGTDTSASHDSTPAVQPAGSLNSTCAPRPQSPFAQKCVCPSPGLGVPHTKRRDSGFVRRDI